MCLRAGQDQGKQEKKKSEPNSIIQSGRQVHSTLSKNHRRPNRSIDRISSDIVQVIANRAIGSDALCSRLRSVDSLNGSSSAQFSPVTDQIITEQN
jgi:hypothetical protein